MRKKVGRREFPRLRDGPRTLTSVRVKQPAFRVVTQVAGLFYAFARLAAQATTLPNLFDLVRNAQQFFFFFLDDNSWSDHEHQTFGFSTNARILEQAANVRNLV